MISQKQKDLADFIKEVHLSLRRRTQEIGAENAWREHLENEKVLEKYSRTMKDLSENFWAVNNATESNGQILCRNEWIVQTVLDYFQNGGLQKEVDKERRKMTVYSQKSLITEDDLKRVMELRWERVPMQPYRVLDVGSCHNPLGKFKFFNVYPIDLYPAGEEVRKCNFVNVPVNKAPGENWFDSAEIKEIPCDFFDVVVFSLYLEYLPSPGQRYLSCEKAYSSLKANGLLVVVTPDSKHATANAHIMKSWKTAAAFIGFNRIKLNKLKYLHCMAFRKSISSKYPLASIKTNEAYTNATEMFVISQDFVDYEVKKTVSENVERNEESVKETFTELPFS